MKEVKDAEEAQEFTEDEEWKMARLKTSKEFCLMLSLRSKHARKSSKQLERRKVRAPRSSWRMGDALGYVLAQEVKTEREYPPFNRATRDGYAVFAADAGAGATLKCTGEIKAGDRVTKELWAETCVQIMTGAAVPDGADAVVMIEHTQRDSDTVRFERAAKSGQNIVPRGSEAKYGQTILTPGLRLGYAELALAAQVGESELRCATKPRVAILSTGDEVVLVDELPGPFQIRNSNSVSLAAQVKLAGGEPVLLGNAADRLDDLRRQDRARPERRRPRSLRRRLDGKVRSGGDRAERNGHRVLFRRRGDPSR